MGGKGGIRGKMGITISTHNIVGGHGEGSIAQRRQVVIPQHLTLLMYSDCKGVYSGDLE